MKQIEVVAAIIICNEKILCMQRGKGKFDYISFKYEFPGGKIETSETLTCALEREIKEEMEIEIIVSQSDYFNTIKHKYPDFEITMHAFICKINEERFSRNEHVNHVWANLSDLNNLDWAAADLPIVEKLISEGENFGIKR